MSWSVTDRFPSWGETGESPGSGFFYEGGDQVNEKHLDYLWNSLKGLEDDVQAALNDIDSNSDGVVDKADAGAAGFDLNGDLVAANGEIIWDESANYIPQARLQNDSITVNGNSVALGGSTTIPTYSDSDAISAINNDTDHGSTASHNYFSGSHNDLSNIGTDDHHAQNHDNSDHTTNYLAQSNYNPEADTHSRPTNTLSSSVEAVVTDTVGPVSDGWTKSFNDYIYLLSYQAQFHNTNDNYDRNGGVETYDYYGNTISGLTDNSINVPAGSTTTYSESPNATDAPVMVSKFTNNGTNASVDLIEFKYTYIDKDHSHNI
jgi:hypothetical protein